MRGRGVSRHPSSRLCLFCRGMTDLVRKIEERMFVTAAQQPDNERTEFPARITRARKRIIPVVQVIGKTASGCVRRSDRKALENGQHDRAIGSGWI